MATEPQFTRLRVLALSGAAFCLIAGQAAAADGGDPGFFATIGAQAGYDDNVRRTEENEESDTFVTVNPRIGTLGRFSKHSLLLTYAGDYGFYSSEDELNYDDHALKADLELDLTPKLNVNLQSGYTLGHDSPSQDRFSAAGDAVEWDEWDVNGEVVYGRRIAKAQVALEGGYLERRYDDHPLPNLADRAFVRAVNTVRGNILAPLGLGPLGSRAANRIFPPASLDTETQIVRDRDAYRARGTFFWNLGPKTQLLAEISRYEEDYLRNFFNANYDLDSTEWRYQGGVTWKATAKTTGEFRIGYYDRDMEARQLPDSSGLTYQLRVIWQPKTYSTVSLQAERSTDITWNERFYDVTGLPVARTTQGAATDNTGQLVATVLGVNWNHEITRRLTLDTGLVYENDDYEQEGVREDDIYDFHFGLQYELTPRTKIGARYLHSQRNSELSGADYQSNTYLLTLSSQFR